MGLILYLLISIIVLLVAGYVVSWAWNTFVVPVFKAEKITTTQGLALFVLVYMLLGFWRIV